MSRSILHSRVVVSLVAVCALLFITGWLPTQAAAADRTTYMSVVDAGSSGSRIAVFTPGALPLGSPTQVMQEEPDVPPLSSFDRNPAQAGPQGIGPLLDQLDTFAAANGIAKSGIPVSVLATAGLRNVELRDPAAAAAIIASVVAYIPTRGYPVGEVSIMSGQREALYAWIDANATQGTLADGDNNLGILEVGGASAQVAFQSPNPGARGVLTTSIGGLTFNVVALSYLGLGQNDARMFMRSSTSGGAECFPNNARSSQPRFYETKSARPLRASKANFQSKACRIAYETVIQKQGASKLNLANNARIRPTGIRNLPGFNDSKFLGVSAIAFDMASFKLSPGPRLGTRFQQAIRTTCTGKNAWKSVIALYSDPKNPFAEGLCANSQYVYALAYGKKGVAVPQSRLNVDVGLRGAQPSWSKGFALTQLNP